MSKPVYPVRFRALAADVMKPLDYTSTSKTIKRITLENRTKYTLTTSEGIISIVNNKCMEGFREY